MHDILIRLAVENDTPRVISLLNEIFSDQQKTERKRTLDTWNWKFQDNIFGETLTIVAENNGRIIGTGTLWPFKFLINGKNHFAYQTCSLGVHENFRGQGVFRKINSMRIQTAKKNNASFLFSFPNQNSLPGYKKMGWNYLGKLPWYVNPISCKDIFLDKFTHSKSEPFNLNVEDKLNDKKINISDDLNRSSNVSLKKSNDFYLWRYCSRPDHKYGFVSAGKKNQNKHGAVYTILKKGDFKEMVIIDFISPDLEMTKNILEEVIKIAKKYKVMFIAFVKPNDFNYWEALKMGFFPIKKKNLTILSLDSEVSDTIGNIKDWYLFAGLHDSI